jgi:hypothetical protein
MSEKIINVLYEGRRKKLGLAGMTFISMEQAIKDLFQLPEEEYIELVAKQKDGTECDLWDDDDIECMATTIEVIAYLVPEVICSARINFELFEL